MEEEETKDNERPEDLFIFRYSEKVAVILSSDNAQNNFDNRNDIV